MMKPLFPRTSVGGVSVSRMIIGTNWILGYSHTSPAADKMIKNRHSTQEMITDILQTYLSYGVDTIIGPFAGNQHLVNAIKEAENITGKKMIIIDTPIINVDDNARARKEAESVIAHSKEIGATFCLPHHSSVEQLVNKNTQTIQRLPDYLQ